MPTKLYRNTGKETLNIIGVGELEPGEQISLTGEYLPAVIIENYPGLIDATDDEAVPAAQAAVSKPAPTHGDQGADDE